MSEQPSCWPPSNTEIRSHPVPHVIAVNGDIFEHGNVVAQRSDGVVDWTFLAALPSLAPTVVNLGNHDNDLTPDLADVVARMKALGLHVVSTIADTRTGVGYAQPVATLPVRRPSAAGRRHGHRFR